MKPTFSWEGSEPGVLRPLPLDPDAGRLLEAIRQDMGGSRDLVVRRFGDASAASPPAALVYIDGISDDETADRYVADVLRAAGTGPDGLSPPSSEAASAALRLLGTIGSGEPVPDMAVFYERLLSGSAMLVLDGSELAYAVPNAKWKEREISESPNQTSIRGPRESFTETLRVNTGLLRRKIKDPRLWMESIHLGRMTKTEVCLVYIQGLAKPSVVAEARSRLQAIDIDGVLDSGYVEELIEDDRRSFFPTMKNTELPDSVAGELLEGKIAILVGGSPNALIAPAPFLSFMQTAEDYYQYALYSSLLRLLRLLGLFIALLLPSIYIAITTFHRDMLPFTLLFSLMAQREGVPFPAFVEALAMEVTFEILREAGLRMPRPIGQAVSVVGTLVIGQAAVEAGIVSAAMVIVVSVTAIATFTLPSYSISIPIRMLRFLFMAVAASFGLYGIILAQLLLLLHLASLKTFGESYMSPIAPLRPRALLDALVRVPRWASFAQPAGSRRAGARRYRGRRPN
ncbi:spore germination protein [Paenibacillus albicereus]|uniref:Spore germination protein n=1 Tax=Paenibacillus albicereus TaxID=2726185 RepID=A0A6H2GUP9_9BACL|nr:spore germination protein [Paenibacillus albicereus]QJC51079.1 spore germination protein [Paenibacillus albicereus]